MENAQTLKKKDTYRHIQTELFKSTGIATLTTAQKVQKSENGPNGSAIKYVSMAGMNTLEIIKTITLERMQRKLIQSHDQEVAKISPTSMESIR